MQICSYFLSTDAGCLHNHYTQLHKTLHTSFCAPPRTLHVPGCMALVSQSSRCERGRRSHSNRTRSADQTFADASVHASSHGSVSCSDITVESPHEACVLVNNHVVALVPTLHQRFGRTQKRELTRAPTHEAPCVSACVGGPGVTVTRAAASSAPLLPDMTAACCLAETAPRKCPVSCP